MTWMCFHIHITHFIHIHAQINLRSGNIGMSQHFLNASYIRTILQHMHSKSLNKPGSLTDEEFAKIKQHPALGYEILKRQPDLDSRIKKAALMHHERCDGSGYPTGLTEDYIDNFAMIVAIADVYDAMTAARSYRSPLCPFEVISKFEEDGFQKYHTKYILVFLKQIASTYQSNRVILSDGRGCTIVMLNQNALSRPIVQFDDKSCLDLSTASRDLYIKAVL